MAMGFEEVKKCESSEFHLSDNVEYRYVPYFAPVRARGVESRMCTSVSPA